MINIGSLFESVNTKCLLSRQNSILNWPEALPLRIGGQAHEEHFTKSNTIHNSNLARIVFVRNAGILKLLMPIFSWRNTLY